MDDGGGGAWRSIGSEASFFFFFSIDRRGVVDEWKVMSTAGMDEKFKGRRSCKYCCWLVREILCVERNGLKLSQRFDFNRI